MNSSDVRWGEDRNSRAFVLGLTGGIGTGKSTAAEYLVSLGFVHIDADAIGRELTAYGSPLLSLLEETFGMKSARLSVSGRPTILDEEGRLDRKALANIVFSDPGEKEKLDSIMFEKIGRIMVERIEDACRFAEEDEKTMILIDAPLLFESGLDRLCDKVLLIVCDIETRVDRVAERDDSSREEVHARIRSQMSDEEKMAKADYVVDNSGSIHAMRAQIDDILSEVVDKSTL